jgi:dTDP-4-dehydrorhamnose reductase
MKILITGAYGQLGNEIKVLAENYPEWQFFLPMSIRWILQVKVN